MNLKNTRKYKEIKSSMLKQLEAMSKDSPWAIDLVEDYMSLFETKEMLKADIAERGVSVPYNNGGGQKGAKKNDSVDLILKVNKQMMAIINELGLKDEIGELIEAL